MEDIRNGVKPGMIVKVHQKIKDVNAKGEEKQRIQMFEGLVLAVKHGNETGATITVRKVSKGIGVEKIFPIHSPVVEKIELVRQMRVHQSRPYYLRNHKKKLREVRKEVPREAPVKMAQEEKKEEAPVPAKAEEEATTK